MLRKSKPSKRINGKNLNGSKTKKKNNKRSSSNKNNATNGYSFQSVMIAIISTCVLFVAVYMMYQNEVGDVHIPSSGGKSATQRKHKSTSTAATSSSSTSSSSSSSSTSISLDTKDIFINQNEEKWNRSDPILQQTYNFLTNYVCNDNDNSQSKSGSKSKSKRKSYCHPYLQPSPKRRTHYVVKTKNSNSSKIKRGETIMILPRHLLIWDLDAMRNREFIQSELFSARHGQTGNSLDSGAFLAAFLVYQERKNKGLWSWTNNDKNNNNDDDIVGDNGNDKDENIPNVVDEDDDDDTKLLEYLNILPSYETHSKTHPVLWNDDELIQMFGKSTVTYQLVQAYKSMIVSEYKAFHDLSEVFRQNISKEDYTRMRINVMSRSFGPGPPGDEESDESIHGRKLDVELDYYLQSTGVDLRKGCRAMSPILDIWDHHARPNVEWRYVRSERAFIIKAVEKEILPWNDIMVSYGMYTDSHLFAKFGFVNDDGSGHTEISIALMHKLLDHGLGQQFSYMRRPTTNDDETKPLPSDNDIQRKNLLQYLISDDGYEECIEKEEDPEAYEFKLLKFRHLQAIANKRDRWTVKFQPRNENSKPAATSSTPIRKDPPRFDPGNVKFDGSKLIETCRLLALTHHDYDGKATEILRKALESGNAADFKVMRQSDELEYRALTWLARLTTIALKKYPKSLREDMTRLQESNIVFHSKEWYALQVRLGEMQSLESLKSIALSGTRHMMERVRKQKKDVKSSAMFIRQTPCKFEHTMKLLE